MVKPLGGFVKLIFEMERIDPLYGEPLGREPFETRRIQVAPSREEWTGYKKWPVQP